VLPREELEREAVIWKKKQHTAHPIAVVEGNGILATQVSNQDTAVLLHYP
jgi:hypothetical protein